MIPSWIELVPIDASARAGGYQFLFGGSEYAVARWAGDRWVLPNGVELHFTPVACRPTPAKELVA